MMRFLPYVLTVFIFLVSLCDVYGQLAKEKKLIVVVDPGHGGTDSGAIGAHGMKEKTIVLGIAKKMARWSTFLFDTQVEVYLTRYTDTLIALSDRTRLARSLKAEVFISLHYNQAENPRAKGIEVYLSDREGIYKKQSLALATAIEKQLVAQIGFKSRGVKFANFQVLRETRDDCLAVLVELGFVSNSEEMEHLSKDANYNAIALALLQSLMNSEGL